MTQEQHLHINCLELLAASFATKALARDYTNIVIKLHGNRQSNSSGLCKPSRRHSLQGGCTNWHQSSESGALPEAAFYNCSTCARQGQHSGRQALSHCGGQEQLAAPTRGLSTPGSTVGALRGRSVCHSSHDSDAMVLQLEAEKKPTSPLLTTSIACFCRRARTFLNIATCSLSEDMVTRILY